MFIFILVYYLKETKDLISSKYTRVEFASLSEKLAAILVDAGIKAGDCVTHFFTANRLVDLLHRHASTFLESIPVTTNWQADSYVFLLCVNVV